MTPDLRVLVYGTIERGSCDVFRFGMVREPLLDHGVELRELTQVDGRVPAEYAGDPGAAVRAGLADFDLAPFEWADVIVFKRFYYTHFSCRGCDFATLDEREATAHAGSTGHVVAPPEDLAVRWLMDRLDRDPAFLAGRAVVYETDDDLFAVQPWTGFAARARIERDLMERMIRRADLVTVTTPVLESVIRRHTDTVRVIRNAVDPRHYPDRATIPDRDGDPRVLYYGVVSRLRDYGVCRDAVEDLRRRRPDTRRVWIGAEDPRIAALVDELVPYVRGLPNWARTLVGAAPDIGLAPVVGDAFDRGHSELHWLEYSMAGAATIASRTMEGGPYDVIRDGVDGLLAKSKDDWRAALRRLAESPALRTDLAGAARERVLAEYDVRQRAGEWADAYRWAAEHAGRWRLGRDRTVAPGAIEAIARDGRARLDRRQRLRSEALEAPTRLAAQRGDRAVCWLPADALDPLVSVPLTIGPEAERDAIRRAIRSVLGQTHGRLEILLAGATGAPALGAVLADLADARVRILDPLEAAGSDDQGASAAAAAALAAAVRAATGAWIAPLDAEVTWEPDHVEQLIGLLIDHELEAVYAQAAVTDVIGGSPRLVGAWPPAPGDVDLATAAWSARLDAIAPDPASRLDGLEPGVDLVRRWAAAGARIGHADLVVSHRTLAHPAAASDRAA